MIEEGRDAVRSRTFESFKDRSTWRPGPWHDEPDFSAWTTREGYLAVASRMETGAWCGMIRIALDHPWFGRTRITRPGYTGHPLDFVTPLHPNPLCCNELPKRGFGDVCGGGWWLGFDCNHCDDYAPAQYEWMQYIHRDDPDDGQFADHELAPGIIQSGMLYQIYKPLTVVSAWLTEMSFILSAVQRGIDLSAIPRAACVICGNPLGDLHEGRPCALLFADRGSVEP